MRRYDALGPHVGTCDTVGTLYSKLAIAPQIIVGQGAEITTSDGGGKADAISSIAFDLRGPVDTGHDSRGSNSDRTRKGDSEAFDDDDNRLRRRI